MADLLDKIKEAEQMLGNEEQAIEIAKLMNLRNFDEEKLTGSSPFSSDSNPSFIWNKKDLCYHDFSNGGNYSIINAYMYAYDETYAQALKRLFDRCHIEFDFKRGFGYDERESLENYKFPVDDSVEDNSNAIAYLKKRGFTEETIKFFDIGQTKKGDVQFKFKDINGRLVGVKYRHARSIKKGESKYWWQSDCSTCHFLFNMDKVDITKPLVITEGNCFPGDAQILTKHGWVNFEDYDNEEVMQVNPDGTSSFVMPLAKVVHEYDGKMVEASQKGRYYTFTTEEHNLVLRSKNGFVKKFAKDMPDSIDPKYTSIPVCAEYNDGKGIPFSDDEIRLFVAFSADGSYNKESCYEKREVNRIRFGFSKKRKFDRLKTILENLGIKYTETVKPSEKYATGTSYYIGFTDENAFLKKNFDWTWLSDMTKHQREVLLEEVCYWDGYRFDSNNIVNTRNIGEYYSTIKNNVEFIQAMCHISGFMATIVHRKDLCDNHSTAMSVHMLYSKDNVSWQKMWSTGKAKKVDYKGMVYCVTVPSGMILVRQKEKISVSGNCDAMAIWQSGNHNVVSIPGGATDLNWIKYNFDFLEKFKKIILWLDNDTAGEEGTKKIVQKLGEYRCYIVESPDYAQEAVEQYYKQFNQEKPIRKTDANNVMIAIDGSAVLKMIADAKAVDNPRIKHLFDYEEMQLQNVPNISFGIRGLNKILYGNFQSTLTLITALPGQGKSSLINQICVAAPLEQNQNVFIYSGEIPAPFLLGNIFRPLASNRHIIEYDNGADRPKGYAVSKQATDLIRNFYHENLYVYDDCAEDDSSLNTDSTGLLQQMDYAYRRYNTTVFVIDNMMSLSLKGCAGDTKLEKQTDFIKQVKMFTRKYPVEVALVAHSRKLAQGENEVGLQSVAGAMEIMNVADRCIACKILNEDSDGYDFQISVVKDRQSGKAGSKLKLYYDNCSMRIFTDEQELNMRYRWERELGNKIHYDDNLSKRIVANIPELKFNPTPTFTSEPDIPTESTQEPNLPF